MENAPDEEVEVERPVVPEFICPKAVEDERLSREFGSQALVKQQAVASEPREVPRDGRVRGTGLEGHLTKTGAGEGAKKDRPQQLRST